jgi:NADP-dependent 3-hydroxy acid dehydrogenase YdfG
MQPLQDQTVLITGASSGFGRGIALACAEAGANVALVARSGQRLREVAAQAEGLGAQTVVCVTDVAHEAQIRGAIAETKAHLGHIDVLVNNAGTNLASRSIHDTTVAEWREILEVNLTSAYLFTKMTLPDMIAQERGTIINVASRAATHPSLLSGVGYATSKQGMQTLTIITNEEANPHNVRACVINPGEGNTPILDKRPAPPTEEERFNMLQPEDLGEAVVFAASMPQRANVWRIDMMPTTMRSGRP